MNMENQKNICSYCRSVEHQDTLGITSVLPTLDGEWFCSTNCLCMYKSNGMRGIPLKKFKNKKHSSVTMVNNSQELLVN